MKSRLPGSSSKPTPSGATLSFAWAVLSGRAAEAETSGSADQSARLESAVRSEQSETASASPSLAGMRTERALADSALERDVTVADSLEAEEPLEASAPLPASRAPTHDAELVSLARAITEDRVEPALFLFDLAPTAPPGGTAVQASNPLAPSPVLPFAAAQTPLETMAVEPAAMFDSDHRAQAPTSVEFAYTGALHVELDLQDVEPVATNFDVPIYAIGALPGEVLLFPATSQSAPLVGLDTFRADPRFLDVDGSGYAIVILDTGIDLDHGYFGPDANLDGIADRIVYQHDFADGDADASDNDNHGSNVSSIAASSGAHMGMAPGADIIHLKVFTDTGSGNFGIVEQALQWVVANATAYNVVSVNMSLSDGFSHATAQSLYGISDEIAALSALDVITVSASGNEFDGDLGVGYPAADPNSLSIGAVYDANIGSVSYAGGLSAFSTGPDRITPFSQRDADLTDVFAPGAAITGANRNGGFVTMHGTSQAAPHIAGIVALAQQLSMETFGRRLTQTEFTELLQSSAVTIFDGDDEDDNVANSSLFFPRVDVLALGEAILAIGPPLPTVSIGDISVAEGDSGSVDAVFTVTLSEASAQQVSIQYTSSDVTASAGSDYVGVSDTLIIDAGQTTGVINVNVLGDTSFENDEAFTLTLSDAVGANLGATELSATGTIVNDDAGSSVVMFQESFEGTGQYTTVGAGSNGSTSYWQVVDPQTGVLKFVPGNTDGNLVFGGRNLDSSFAGQSGSGALRTIRFNEVDLTQHGGVTVTLALAARPLTATGRRFEDEDFIKISASTDNGSSFQQLDFFVGPPTGSGPLSNGSVELIGDFTDLSYAIADSAQTLIIEVQAYDDGGTETIAIDNLRIEGVSSTGEVSSLSIAALDAIKPEGDSGSSGFEFIVTRSGDLDSNVDVDFQVAGTGSTPAGIDDFLAGSLPGGTLSFAAGEASKPILIDVTGDTDIEADEDFTVSLSNPTGGAQIVISNADGTIVDDDAPAGTPELIFQESFEGTNQFSTIGEGSASTKKFWQVTDATNPNLLLALGNADGSFVFGGRNLDASFAGQAGPSAIRTVTFDEVDLSQHSAVEVTVALAAKPANGLYESQDFIQVSASTDGGSSFQQWDYFVGPPAGSGRLSNGGIDLIADFTDLAYAIADGVDSVIIEIQSLVNGRTESVALDNLRIEGVAAPGPSAGPLATSDDLFVFAPATPSPQFDAAYAASLAQAADPTELTHWQETLAGLDLSAISMPYNEEPDDLIFG